MNRNIIFSEGEYYHVYNRGVEKRDIFLLDADRKRFQTLLYLANGSKPVVWRLIQGSTLYDTKKGEPLVVVGAYCLMSNHFHLLVKEVHEGGLVKFMQKLTTGYTMYFNKVNKRVGPLFQGRFKARHVDRDEYLKYLFAYIHLNPVKLIDPEWKQNGISDKEAAKSYLKDYQFSSYADLTGEIRPERAILTPEAFPSYFDTPQHFDTFIEDWLAFKDEEELEREVEEQKKEYVQEMLVE